jgi:hypothetical protein
MEDIIVTAMKKGIKIVIWGILCILFILGFGWVTMKLWNWLVPVLFNGPHISFIQALGLLLLSKIIFGGWGRHCGCGHKTHWKHRYYDKMSSMSAEEKARFKARVWEKWCPGEKKTSGTNSDTSIDK